MSRLPIVMIGLAVAWSFACAQAPAPQSKPDEPAGAEAKKAAPKADVDVRIIVASRNSLEGECEKGGLHPTTILVSTNERGNEKDKGKGNAVYHCIDGKFIPHAEHGKNPLLEKAIVRLKSGQRVRWFSTNASFFVASVDRPPQDLKNSAPASPFASALATTFANEVISPPVIDVPNVEIQQQYKVSFSIQEVGLVDPDLVCSM